MRAIGTMSGTSMDGIDVAMLETDGEKIEALGPSTTYPYNQQERELIKSAIAEAAAITDRYSRLGSLAEAENCITDSHEKAINRFLKDYDIDRKSIDVVGFHGHTILHRPQTRMTMQIGNGALLAEALEIEVVHDFRAADMLAGGQGAPLAPVFHRALAKRGGLPLPIVIVNLGGVANVTFIGEDGDLLAFDTGPGNALIDDWVQRHTDKPFDEFGNIAAKGKPDSARLEALLSDPYFLSQPPKSLDRNAFSLAPLEGMSVEDGAATLTAFTVAGLICSLAHLPATPSLFILSGGGVHNSTIVENIRKLTPGRVEIADDLGWNADAIEAQAFGYMAVRSICELPLSFPGTTGVNRPTLGGVRTNPVELLPAMAEYSEAP